MKKATVVATAAVCLSALGWQGTVHAAPCSSLPNPVIVGGSTAVANVLKAVAIKLAAATGDDKMTIVVASNATGSCGGVDAIGQDTGACTATSCATGGKFYSPTGDLTESCEVEAGGSHLDVVFSDVFKSSCTNTGAANPALADDKLLVLPFGFIVPRMSDQTAIDAVEAYYVFGQGSLSPVAPWVNDKQIFRRDQNSGTQITIYKNIMVPPASTAGIIPGSDVNMPKNNSGGVRDAVAAGNASTIGIIGLDAVLANRGSTVNVLAYRHFKQDKYYWPDSTKDTFDNKNVRDGHYPLWGYEHGIYLTSNGQPVSPRGKKLADILAGKVALPGGDMVTVNAQQGTIPLCAMDVTRPNDAADFAVSTETSCGCAYEKATSSGITTPTCPK